MREREVLQKVVIVQKSLDVPSLVATLTAANPARDAVVAVALMPGRNHRRDT